MVDYIPYYPQGCSCICLELLFFLLPFVWPQVLDGRVCLLLQIEHSPYGEPKNVSQDSHYFLERQ